MVLTGCGIQVPADPHGTLDRTRDGAMRVGVTDNPPWVTLGGTFSDWVAENCWSDARQSYVTYPGSEQLDAAVLLHATNGFDGGPRMSATIDAIREELGRGALVYRYTGMEKEEGAFVVCSFWMASALACVGRHDEGLSHLALVNAAITIDELAPW